jgi:hypothetical protein
MAIIRIKRGPTVPTGLTAGELAWDYVNSNLFIGATGTQIVRIAGSNSVQTFNGLSGAVSGVTTSVANTFTPVQTFNAGINSAGATFTALTRFTSGISANGGATFHGQVRFASGLTATGITLNGDLNFAGTGRSINSSGDLTLITTSGVNSSRIVLRNTFSNDIDIAPISTLSGGEITKLRLNAYAIVGLDEFTSSWTIQPISAPGAAETHTISLPRDSGTVALAKNVVSSFNGITGAVTGVTTGTANTFGPLQSFTNGISASGSTFSGTVSSSGFILTSDGIKSLTGTTYTFLSSDNGDVITHNNASGCTFTIPTGLPVGFSTTVIRLNGTGRVGFIAASGVTLNVYGGFTGLAGQHASASLISYASNIFNLSGNLI